MDDPLLPTFSEITFGIVTLGVTLLIAVPWLVRVWFLALEARDRGSV